MDLSLIHIFVWGDWPKAYNEIVLVVNEHNELSDLTLSALGLRSKEELIESYRAAQRGEQIDTSQVRQWSYDEIGEKTFEMILSADLYRQQSDGTYVNISEDVYKRQLPAQRIMARLPPPFLIMPNHVAYLPFHAAILCHRHT